MIRILKKVALFILISHLSYVVLLRFFDPPFTLTQLGSLLSGNGFRRNHISLNEMSTASKLAILSAEDQLFPDHNGFDIKGIKAALDYNKRKKGKKFRGASTISQQVAKNVFLWPDRSYLRKGLEAYFTVLIEVFWSKKRIMEVYLNEIEMGDGIYGVEEAAKYYFKKPASDLSKRESAAIAAILPNPIKWSASKPNALS